MLMEIMKNSNTTIVKVKSRNVLARCDCGNDSNTTIVKVKSTQLKLYRHIIRFKYNDC